MGLLKRGVGPGLTVRLKDHHLHGEEKVHSTQRGQRPKARKAPGPVSASSEDTLCLAEIHNQQVMWSPPAWGAQGPPSSALPESQPPGPLPPG